MTYESVERSRSRGNERAAQRPPILHLHPTRRCNLACRHCYSSSGPSAAESLGADIMGRVLADARSLGYKIVAFSGGEPLLYPDLLRVLDTAKDQGLTALLASNGFPVTSARVASLRG